MEKHSYRQRGHLNRLLKVRYETQVPGIIKHDTTKNKYIRATRDILRGNENWMLEQLYSKDGGWVTSEMHGGTIIF